MKIRASRYRPCCTWSDWVAVPRTAGRGYARWIPQWHAAGYQVNLWFLRLPDPEFAIARVRQRVREGGHNVPEPVIRRRFEAGLRNFTEVYRSLVNRWTLYDNSGSAPVLLDEGVSPETRA